MCCSATATEAISTAQEATKIALRIMALPMAHYGPAVKYRSIVPAPAPRREREQCGMGSVSGGVVREDRAHGHRCQQRGCNASQHSDECHRSSSQRLAGRTGVTAGAAASSRVSAPAIPRDDRRRLLIKRPGSPVALSYSARPPTATAPARFDPVVQRSLSASSATAARSASIPLSYTARARGMLNVGCATSRAKAFCTMFSV